MLTIGVLSSDPSGDLQAAALVEQLKQRHPDWNFVGMGGQHSRRAGVSLWSDTSLYSIIGVSEAITRLPLFVLEYWKVRQTLLRTRPDLTIFIDSPAVHMRLASVAKKAGLRCIYYFPPSGWSTNPKRLRNIYSKAEALIPAFAFAAEQYAKLNLPVAYFGHPLVDLCQPIPRPLALQRLGLPEGNYAALMPGSRTQEIRLLLPIFLETAHRFASKELLWLVPTANPQIEQLVRKSIACHPTWLRILSGSSREVMSIARAGLLASGSATLEACLLNMPHLIGYKLDRFDWFIGQILHRLGLLNVPMFGLPNLVLQNKLIPEFLQNQLTADNLEKAFLPLLQEGPQRQTTLNSLLQVREKLGAPGSISRIATFVEKMAQNQSLNESLREF